MEFLGTRTVFTHARGRRQTLRCGVEEVGTMEGLPRWEGPTLELDGSIIVLPWLLDGLGGGRCRDGRCGNGDEEAGQAVDDLHVFEFQGVPAPSRLLPHPAAPKQIPLFEDG